MTPRGAGDRRWRSGGEMSGGRRNLARPSVARGVWLLPLADLSGLLGGVVATRDALPDRPVSAGSAAPALAVTATGVEAATASERLGAGSPETDARPARGRGDDSRSSREVTPNALLEMSQLQGLGADVRQAARTFAELALRPPPPATLDAGVDGLTTAEPSLRARLRSIGHKTHANRASRRYWLRQRDAVDALVAALQRLPLPPESPPTPAAAGAGAPNAGAPAAAAARADAHSLSDWADQLRAYRECIEARIVSDDGLLIAIEAERDVIEERLEALGGRGASATGRGGVHRAALSVRASGARHRRAGAARRTAATQADGIGRRAGAAAATNPVSQGA